MQEIYRSSHSTGKFSLPRGAAPRLALALGLIFLLHSGTFAAEAPKSRPKRVLIISTGSRLSPGFTLIDRAILEALGTNPSERVDIHAENLDILRFPADRFQRIFGEYLTVKYAEQPPDLIILVFVGNLEIAGKLLDRLFPGTPVIVAGATEEEVRADKFHSPVSGVVFHVNPRATLDLIFRLQPETRRVVVIGGSAEVDRHVLDRVKAATRSFAGRVEFEFWDTRSMAELHQAVVLLPPQTVILFSRMFRDGAGQAVISTQAGQLIAQWSNVPVYVMTDTALGTGAVGGSVANVEAIGKRAGELARLVLSGTAPGSLPLETNTGGVPMFDWRALQRWGIRDDRLPPDSVVRFRPQSVWQQYRWYIVGAALLICLQSGLITALVLQRRGRRRVERVLRESQQLMELATGAADVGLWSRDLAEGDVWANESMRSLYGFGADDPLRFEDMLARIHPDDRARVLAEVERAQVDGLPFEGEFRIRLPNGTERWVLAKGRTVVDPGDGDARRMGVVLDTTERKRGEEKLRESEENLRRLVETTAAVPWQADPESWTFTYVGPQAVKLLGYPLEEWYRKDFWVSHLHPDDRDFAINTCLTTSRTSEDFEFEYRLTAASGESVWVHDIVKCEHRNGKLLHLRGFLLDITDRKQAEQALRESEARFRMMADTAPVMIWMSDRDKLCTFFNKGWLDFTGRTLEQELGNGWAEGVHRDDLDRCLEIYRRSFDARQEFTMEYRLRRWDGEYSWVVDHGVPRFEADGTFLGYIGSCVDVTELKGAQDRLESERAFLRQVLDVNPNFIFAKDRAGRFTLVNQAVAEAYGTTVEELTGRTDADFNPNREEVESFRRMDLEVMDRLEERFIPEEHVTDARGRVRYLQTVKRPIIDKDGIANQVLGASTDITRRKETELELQEQRGQLAHLTRMSTMGELAASLAHELNQPLTAILSNAQAALRFMTGKPSDLEEVREILQDIVRDNSRAAEVIRRMRALVKKEERVFVALDLAGLIGDVMQLVRSDAILRDIRVLFQASSKLPLVRGDKVQLQQVVLNLLLNAFDAMKETPAAERKVAVRAEMNGAGTVEVAIRDRGSGLTSDKLDRIFQPFFTTKREGLGMGLSISRSIIDAHGGRLWAENNSDRGATFYFTVPVEGGAGRRE